jgi:hypothetical protein
MTVFARGQVGRRVDPVCWRKATAGIFGVGSVGESRS